MTAVLALRGSPPVPVPADAPGATSVSTGTAGLTLVPVTLAGPGTAAVLRSGDVVDLVAVDDAGTSRVVATGAQVVTRVSGSSLIGGSSAPVLLMAVPPGDAVDLATTAVTSSLTAVIRRTAADG